MHQQTHRQVSDDLREQVAGFDWGSIHEVLEVPAEEFDAEAMVAIGERAAPETLPEELAEHEHPSDRKDLEEILFQGSFE